MISRPLWATYVVTPEQKSSGILISELFEVRKWVVEKFHGISPGLLDTATRHHVLQSITYRPQRLNSISFSKKNVFSIHTIYMTM